MSNADVVKQIRAEAFNLIRDRLTSEPLTGEQIGLYVAGVVDMQIIVEHLIRRMDSDITINYESIKDKVTDPVLGRMPESHI